MKSTKIIILPFLVLILAVGVLLYGKWNDQPRDLFYSGVLEARQYDLAFEVSGTLAKLSQREGEMVEAGQLLATLDQRELQQRLKAAEATYESKLAQSEDLKNGSRKEDILAAAARLQEADAELSRLRNGPTAEELQQLYHQKEAARYRALQATNGTRKEQIEQAEARLEQAQAELRKAAQDKSRYEALLLEGAAPEAVTEDAVKRYRSATARVEEQNKALEELKNGPRVEEKARIRQEYLASDAGYREARKGTRPELIEAAQARRRAAQAQYDLVRNGPTPEQLKQAQESAQAALAEVDRLKVVMGKTHLSSPVNGFVSALPFEAGETVSMGTPVIQLTQTDDVWVDIFLPETDLGRVKVGEPCEVTLDSLPGKVFQARVSYIAQTAEFTPRFVQTERERVLLVYRAKVSITDPTLELKPGSPADVQVKP